MKITWEEQENGNETLSGDGFYLSYNPHTGVGHSVLTDLANMMGGNVHDGEETALYDHQTWYILEGDFRKEYEMAFPYGLGACLAIYKRFKKDHRSNWSTDKTEEDNE